MIKVIKDNPVNNNGEIYERYIKLYGFRDELEQDLVYKKILQLIKDMSGRTRVW